MAAPSLRGYFPRIGGVVLILLLSGSGLMAQPQTQPAATEARGRGGRGPAMMLVEQISLALEGLNLNFDQQGRVDQILADTRTRARGMAQELANADMPTRRGRTLELMLEVREKIVPILTADQAKSFDQRMQDLRLNPAGAPLAAPRPIGQMVEQLYDAVLKLSLSDEQKPKIESQFNETRKKFQAIRDNPPGDGTAPQKMIAMVIELREHIMPILSEEQQAQLRRVISESGNGLDARPSDARPSNRGRAGRGGRGAPEGMQPDMMGDGMAGGSRAGRSARTEPAGPADLPGVPVGEMAPDFTLNNLDGRPTTLSTYKGKLVLLAFGSYSSPSFRQRAQGLEQIRSSYGARLSVIVIYTKEAYPVGEWEVERNKDDGIAIEQAKDTAARVAEARKARTTLRLTSPFLVDNMDNSIATQFGGFTNSAVLIGRDGKVLHRQAYFEPYALRRYIDEAVKTP